MGGMGFIEANKAACMISVLINTHLLMAGRDAGVERHFFSSSACVYNVDPSGPDVTALREEDAYPALPEDGYGWEKLFCERMCRHFHEDFGLGRVSPGTTTSTGRTGPGTAGARRRRRRSAARSPRQSSPAARDRDLGRRRADAQLHVHRRLPLRNDAIMASDIVDPINLGSDELVTINQLVDIVEEIAGIRLKRRTTSTRRRAFAGATRTTR